MSRTDMIELAGNLGTAAMQLADACHGEQGDMQLALQSVLDQIDATAAVLQTLMLVQDGQL